MLYDTIIRPQLSLCWIIYEFCATLETSVIFLCKPGNFPLKCRHDVFEQFLNHLGKVAWIVSFEAVN